MKITIDSIASRSSVRSSNPLNSSINNYLLLPLQCFDYFHSQFLALFQYVFVFLNLVWNPCHSNHASHVFHLADIKEFIDVSNSPFFGSDTSVKSANPRVKEIVKRLWEIGERIAELHYLKEECRESDPKYESSDYWEVGIEHCKDCEEMSKEQDELREERSELFGELEEICKKDKRTIQLARKYLRE